MFDLFDVFWIESCLALALKPALANITMDGALRSKKSVPQDQ
jgi:hypothetical protein